MNEISNVNEVTTVEPIKKYIADTNILIRQPEILDEYYVIIPSHVNREIEHLELVRASDRFLQWQIRQLKKKIDQYESPFVNIKDYKFTLDDDLDGNYVDNILLQICHDEGYGMITNDRLLRQKCRDYGIEVVRAEVSTFIENKGFQEIELSETQLNKMMEVADVNVFDLMINEYIIVNNRVNGDLLDIIKWDGEVNKSLRDEKGKLFGEGLKTIQFGDLTPRDEQQIMAVDSILTNQLTSIRGRAGSGKSLIALYTAWHLVESKGYKLVMFVNPTPLRDSQELGFYKGDRLEKLMQSAVGTMLSSKFGGLEGVTQAIGENKLEILPFVDLRGYDSGDLPTVVWILEAQNLTSDLMKLGLQRISEKTKVIVDGDYDAQVDKDAYASNNGMKRMSEVFRGTDLYGEVELQNVWRSRLADLADKM